MKWTWLMLAFLFNSCFAKPEDERNMKVSEEPCYLRAEMQECGDATHLNVKIDDVVRHLERLDDEDMLCLPVYCDTDRSSIVGEVTFEVDTGPVGPKVTGKVNGLFSDKSACQAGSRSEHIVISCTEEVEVNQQEDPEKSLSQTNDFALIEWQNHWDGHLKVEAGNCRGFCRVRSFHDNHREDRLWQWDAYNVAVIGYNHCYWTGWTWWDEPFFVQCGSNFILNGIESYHDNHREDRRWRFKCCHAPHYYTRHCFSTGYINYWDGWMDYGVGAPWVFTGVFSWHDNGREDRLWKLEVCHYAK